MIKKILIGVDDSKYAEHAAEYGFKLAESLNAHVGLVNIVEPMAIPMTGNGADEILGTPMQGMGLNNNTAILDAQSEISAMLLERTAKKFGGKLQVTHFNEYGTSGDGIVNCSIEFKADLIVIGTHSRSGFDRLFSSHVAEYVVRHSLIPVLVVPTKE
jgi:nucleotide-binding universal stress UspA family protein